MGIFSTHSWGGKEKEMARVKYMLTWIDEMNWAKTQWFVSKEEAEEFIKSLRIGCKEIEVKKFN
jgi:hypothetical protein